MVFAKNKLVESFYNVNYEDNRNISVYVFITEIIWLTVDVIIDIP